MIEGKWKAKSKCFEKSLRENLLTKGQIVVCPVTLRRKEIQEWGWEYWWVLRSLCQEDSPCAVSLFMEENSCKW